MASLSPHSFNPHLYTKLGFEPIKDFAPVAPGIYGASFLVGHGDIAGEQAHRSSSRSPRRARASSTSAPEARDPRSISSA
jgi:hypothetical protein